MAINVTASQYKRMDSRVESLAQQLNKALQERDRAKSSDGDRSENSALDAAEREVEILQKQLEEAKRELKNANIVKNVDTSRVNLLTKVTLQDENGSTQTVTIVDDGQGRHGGFVSIGSRMGIALKNRIKGDRVRFQDNRFRTREYLVVDIQEAD